jgi:hypothetical protein
MDGVIRLARAGSIGARGVVRRLSGVRAGLLLPALAASALLAAGCGDPKAAGAARDGSAPPAGAATPRPTPRAYTVNELGAAVGCTPKVTSKAADYRQAECTAAGIPYVLLDFDTAEGQRAWLDYAEMYGGIYLVGDRWALSAKSKEFMEQLSAKLGGKVEEKGMYGSSSSPSS